MATGVPSTSSLPSARFCAATGSIHDVATPSATIFTPCFGTIFCLMVWTLPGVLRATAHPSARRLGGSLARLHFRWKAQEHVRLRADHRPQKHKGTSNHKERSRAHFGPSPAHGSGTFDQRRVEQRLFGGPGIGFFSHPAPAASRTKTPPPHAA